MNHHGSPVNNGSKRLQQQSVGRQRQQQQGVFNNKTDHRENGNVLGSQHRQYNSTKSSTSSNEFTMNTPLPIPVVQDGVGERQQQSHNMSQNVFRHNHSMLPRQSLHISTDDNASRQHDLLQMLNQSYSSEKQQVEVGRVVDNTSIPRSIGDHFFGKKSIAKFTHLKDRNFRTL